MDEYSSEAAITEAKQRLREELREKLAPYVASDKLKGAVHVAEKAAEEFAGAFHAALDRERVRRSRDQRKQENG